jgi:hypothetical protein
VGDLRLGGELEHGRDGGLSVSRSLLVEHVREGVRGDGVVDPPCTN